MQIIFQDPGQLAFAAHERRRGHRPSAQIARASGDATGAGMPFSGSWRRSGSAPAEYLYRKYPHQLSGGQSQRVVIARALSRGPTFIVADEPIAMADVSVRALILQLMRQLKDEMGLTYLFITHDLATAKYLCDRVAVMYLGADRGARHAGRALQPSASPLHEGAPRRRPDSRSQGAEAQEPPGRGEIPSAIDPPSGCHFHPRCPYAMPACSLARPPLRDLGSGALPRGHAYSSRKG